MKELKDQNTFNIQNIVVHVYSCRQTIDAFESQGVLNQSSIPNVLYEMVQHK